MPHPVVGAKPPPRVMHAGGADCGPCWGGALAVIPGPRLKFDEGPGGLQLTTMSASAPSAGTRPKVFSCIEHPHEKRIRTNTFSSKTDLRAAPSRRPQINPITCKEKERIILPKYLHKLNAHIHSYSRSWRGGTKYPFHAEPPRTIFLHPPFSEQPPHGVRRS
jgi:hypothetical protein